MDLPNFDQAALSSLTQKIRSNIQKNTNELSKPITTAHPSKDRAKNGLYAQEKGSGEAPATGKKRSRDGQIKRAGSKGNNLVPVVEAGRFGGVSKMASEEISIHQTKTNKRPVSSKSSKTSHQQERNQQEFTSSELKGTKNEAKNYGDKRNGTKKGLNQTKHGSAIYSNLKDEVLALGGTAEDLGLVENAESESEVEGTASSALSGSLAGDLQKFIKIMGIEKAEVDDRTWVSEETMTEQAKKSIDISNPNEIALIVRKNVEDQPKIKVDAQRTDSSNLKFEPRSEWHSVQLPSISNTSPSSSLPPRETINHVHEYAKKILEEENKKYALQNGSSSTAHQFYSTIMTSGTLSDKISALTLSIQESPLHNTKALESLVGLAKKRSRAQAVEVLGALKDLFGAGSLLPSDRKLIPFSSQTGLSAFSGRALVRWRESDPLPSPLKDVHLMSWAYEDWLKAIYFETLKIIEIWCNDEIFYARGKAVDYVYELLRDKPEQEANLLRLLVNKLGDSDKKIASKTSYNIIQLETSHPLMKLTIIKSIESDLLFRPGQSMHAKYYAAITLNQTVLSGREEDVARKLLDVYFSLFLALLAKPEAAKSPSLETRVTFNSKGEKQGGGGAAGKKAKKKQELQAKNLTVDEELREKMLSAVLTGVNRAIPYTKTDDESFEKHLNTLFRITHSSNFNTSIQALMLIQQLCGSHQAASDRFYRTLYESLLDPRLLTSSKQAMYLNLLFRALRADLNVKRVKAFAKRLLQVVMMHQPSFACGVIYLLRELEGVFANLRAFVDQPEVDDSDGEETFHDVDEGATVDRPSRAIAIELSETQRSQFYDGRKREPEHSNADKSCLWELAPFLLHFHPSVALYASKLAAHQIMPAKPDLSMNTLIHFLDRFVYRNPKKSASVLRGASVMQPLAGGDASSLLVSTGGKHDSKAPVNTEAFWKMDDSKVAADEVFFHKYFNTLGKSKASEKKRRDVESIGESGEQIDGENEDEIWKALVDSRPELEGSDQSDVDMDDFESALGKGNDEGEEFFNDAEESDFGSMDDDDMEGLDFGDDEDALLGSDAELPSDLEEVTNVQTQPVLETGDGTSQVEERKQKRRRLKNLPTFASVDDYATMLGADDAED